MSRIVFGGWTPDQPDFGTPGMQLASNVYPASLGYRPVGAFAPLSDALESPCTGAASFSAPDGSTVIIAGTASYLYRSTRLGWYKLGTDFETSDDGRWRFAQFGGIAIATNGTAPMQKIDLSSFTVWPLGGGAPKAKLLTVVKDFVVAGVINGDTRTLMWSGINDAEFWTASENQCDFQIMPTGGEITGLLGGEVGIILQRGRVSRMSYVGGNLIFQFDEISYNIGCVTRHSVAQSGVYGFFLSDNGFVMWDGAALKPIGFERVDRTFARKYGKNSWRKMSTAVDSRNNLVCWSMGDEIYVYNWVLDKWSVIQQQAQIIFSAFSRGLTLEEVGQLFPNIDTMPLSLDSDVFQDGNPVMFLFDTSNRMGAFRGKTMKATLELPQQEFIPGRDTRVNQVRPLTDATAGLELTIEARERMGDAVTANAYSYLTQSGEMPVRESGRYLKMAATIDEATRWTYIEGLEVGTAGGIQRGGRR